MSMNVHGVHAITFTFQNKNSNTRTITPTGFSETI